MTITLNVFVPEVTLVRKNPIKTLLTSAAFLGFLIGVIGQYTLGCTARLVYDIISWSPILLSYTATYTMGLRVTTKLSVLNVSRRTIVTVGAYRFAVAPPTCTTGVIYNGHGWY